MKKYKNFVVCSTVRKLEKKVLHKGIRKYIFEECIQKFFIKLLKCNNQKMRFSFNFCCILVPLWVFRSYFGAGGGFYFWFLAWV